ncbi:MAG: hypothetical protein Q9163_005665 [Psora crenata]
MVYSNQQSEIRTPSKIVTDGLRRLYSGKSWQDHVKNTLKQASISAMLPTTVNDPCLLSLGRRLALIEFQVIATSGPSSTYPRRAYRNPTDALVKFLDYKHGSKWAIWEFRAEGTGYPDSEVYNRIRHYPWPDHHPPPFSLLPNILASMRDWLKGPDAEKGRVVVVHCKAGKGRSGTVATSYMISEEGWSVEDAMLRFTARRMRSGFGNGISIPSQVRWVGYVDWWAKHGKVYVERQIEIVEVHVWGLRDGVKIAVEGYVDEGRLIKTFHIFKRHERTVMDNTCPDEPSPALEPNTGAETTLPCHQADPPSLSHEPAAAAVLFRPSVPLVLPTSDVNFDLERRNRAKYGLTMVTSVAHVWFNAFFESQYALQQSISNSTSSVADTPPAQILDPTDPPTSGVFSVHWDAMDGIKGSARKGSRALDRLSVVWRAVPASSSASLSDAKNSTKIIRQPEPGEPVPDSSAPGTNDSSGGPRPDVQKTKNLGLRAETPDSSGVSRASSRTFGKEVLEDHDSWAGVRSYGPKGEQHVPPPDENMIGKEIDMGKAHIEDLPESEQSLPGNSVKR